MEGILIGDASRVRFVPLALGAKGRRKSLRFEDLKFGISKGGRKGFVPLRCISSDDVRDILLLVIGSNGSEKESPAEAARKLLSKDFIANFVEVREWESGKSLDTILENQGIRIRRRPPNGPPAHSVGPFEFRLESEGNTPRNILEKIIWNKDVEVAQLRERKPLSMINKDIKNAPPVRDFLGALKASYQRTGMPALIAEVKKASPSSGVLREDFDPVQIAHSYEKNGAACLSVLADEKYFQGSFENLEAIRRAGVKCPLLCKEFIIDAWQIYYARSKGADAVLLIAAVLPNIDIKYMSIICQKLGMAALVEVHNEREIDRVLGITGIELIGINNRDLETFVVDISNTKKLLEGERGEVIRQKGITVVGESGLFTPEDIAFVQNAGAHAVLVGESLIKQDDPGKGIAQLFGKDISS
ncbi:indole-3-glycerol phosphate synthase, chloroplastic isoform X1 [Dendrobium catenatum]|uniref:indole-3-glycerol-phosphate synthase n=1 Tax=Dendrobium nobile TaxID=94219 RepID=A0A7T0BQY8_DENNO|nr:indole-3-glycerol phosphate synthase, chloroplastic isoform X1 [Dendrobium catenatum]QPJ58157.1 chloroplastic indole-3-glycerol phosphate synthase [Dendrobium nobile]